jgi:hypothetical protein
MGKIKNMEKKRNKDVVLVKEENEKQEKEKDRKER